MGKKKRVLYAWYVIDTTPSNEIIKYKDKLHVTRNPKRGRVLFGPFEYRQQARNVKKDLTKLLRLKVANPWDGGDWE